MHVPRALQCIRLKVARSAVILCIFDPDADKNEIRKQAVFFKKEPLSEYHIKVNEAACLGKPSMLMKRGELLLLTKQKVHESGFSYCKVDPRYMEVLQKKDLVQSVSRQVY